ncbi:oxygen-independent coproporphyrinogen III oxidase [Thiohalophilus sp.]|uniref:oxygen-independent coproporphyrinogen III oxidase n=1 Tax=Thiohalophilus sp. TaxID=3028392 RepID=UPI003975ECD8
MYELEFDKDLIRRYDKAGPRYTSYPTAVQFHEDFGSEDYRRLAMRSNQQGCSLSLYFHLPFCNTVCFYCACSKVITANRRRAAPYLQRLHREIELQSELFDSSRPVEQLHWGGGTPTFISHTEMRELMDKTRQHFHLLEDDSGEYSIEIDPREADRETLALLRELGFNRISLGVQDFDPAVQKAVNRIQSEAQVTEVMEAVREYGFRSTSFDLIYGLPLQSVESFSRTLDKVLALQPERLSIFNYAHLPDLFKSQRQINAQDLPGPDDKLAIFKYSIDKLTEAGYVYIGMDHFARPDDELAIAQRNGTLHRNFQGYSTHAECDLVAMGTTAIGKVADSYSQNVKTMDEYFARIDQNQLPVFRGRELDGDDLLRREIINQLICQFTLSFPALELAFDISVAEYFATELAELKAMQEDGLLQLDERGITVLGAGQLLIRNICMVFDKYLRQQQTRRYSKVI